MSLIVLSGTDALDVPRTEAEQAQLNENIAWALETVRARAGQLRLYDDYYDGEHRLLFATEKFRNTFGHLFRAFSDNLCPAVVDSAADRMQIESFSGPLADRATKLWGTLRLPTSSGQVWHDAFRLGDGYMLVWPNTAGKVTMWPIPPQQCAVEYDTEEPGKVIRGGRVWEVTTGENKHHWRVNIYYPDRIERFITRNPFRYGSPQRANAFVPYTGDEVGSLVRNPHGICPLFHFANNNRIGGYGVSELKPAIPIQDALNKAVCDMLVAMEFVAMPQRYATGLEVEVNPDSGKPENPPFTPGVDRIWTAPGNVKFGEFSQASLEGFLAVQDSFRAEMGRVTGRPLHMLMLSEEFPSGESQRTAEARFIKMLQDRTKMWGPEMAEAMLLAIKMDGGSADFEDPESLVAVWGGVQPNNPLFDAETALVKRQVGVSTKQNLRELGYSAKQIEEMEKELEEEDERKLTREVSRMEKLASFQAANPGGGGNPGSSGAGSGDQSRFGPGGRPSAYNRNGSPGQQSRTDPGGQVNQTRQAQRRRTNA